MEEDATYEKMEIKPYTKNAKKHPQKQVEQIAESIKRFGMNQPIVVDKNGVIIVGHGRYLALQHLGWEIKPEWVKMADNLTPEEVSAYRLADNKLNESEWDMDLVLEDLKDLEEDLVELTGFDKDLILNPDDFGDEFSLADGDKSPFQQITFTLADEQAETIKDAISAIKKTDAYKFTETMGNENSNGNALYVIVKEWQEQKT